MHAPALRALSFDLVVFWLAPKFRFPPSADLLRVGDSRAPARRRLLGEAGAVRGGSRAIVMQDVASFLDMHSS